MKGDEALEEGKQNYKFKQQPQSVRLKIMNHRKPKDKEFSETRKQLETGSQSSDVTQNQDGSEHELEMEIECL